MLVTPCVECRIAYDGLTKAVERIHDMSLYASVQGIKNSPFLPHGAGAWFMVAVYNLKGLQRKLLPLDYLPVKLGEAVNGNTILKIIDFIFYFAF